MFFPPSLESLFFFLSPTLLLGPDRLQSTERAEGAANSEAARAPRAPGGHTLEASPCGPDPRPAGSRQELPLGQVGTGVGKGLPRPEGTCLGNLLGRRRGRERAKSKIKERKKFKRGH